MKVNKLVRDNIPKQIMASGRSVKVRTLTGSASFRKALVDKVHEEYRELVNALEGGSEEEIANELVDLLDVANTLYSKLDNRAMYRAAYKGCVNGLFYKRVFLEEILDE